MCIVSSEILHPKSGDVFHRHRLVGKSLLELGIQVALATPVPIPTSALEEQIGVLLDHQEQALSDAIRTAFDLD